MKRGAVIGDLHCGSIFGLLPPNFETTEGAIKLQNPAQEYLYECFDDFTLRVSDDDPDFVIVNGDCVDGRQRKQEGSELSLTMMIDQERAAIACLKLLKSRVKPECKWYFTQGTSYHVGHAGEHEERIAEALGAEKYWSVGPGLFARKILWLEIEGVLVEASHHISATTGFYKLNALEREMQMALLASRDPLTGIPKPDVLIRNHVHYFRSAEMSDTQGIIVPCWQLPTDFMFKHSAYRMLPNIGGVRFSIDGEKKRRGQAPCLVERELYKLPTVQITQLA